MCGNTACEQYQNEDIIGIQKTLHTGSYRVPLSPPQSTISQLDSSSQSSNTSVGAPIDIELDSRAPYVIIDLRRAMSAEQGTYREQLPDGVMTTPTAVCPSCQ